jgi:cytoskeleton protein RodZ
MEQGIGTILREARNRREIELAEVEAATRIRLRYLRAIENEEWDVLPGGVYTRGFVRTYAAFLGLDGERLTEDFRQQVEGWSRGPARQSQPKETSASLGTRTGFRLPLGAATWIAVAAVLVIAAAVIIAIPGGGGGDNGASVGSGAPRKAERTDRKAAVEPPSTPPGLSMQLAASAEVWVCLLDAQGRPLVNGQILEAGAEEGPFRSGSFTVSFGNGEVSMRIDGREAEIPATSSPIGYSIDSSGNLTELSETERPTCT